MFYRTKYTFLDFFIRIIIFWFQFSVVFVDVWNKNDTFLMKIKVYFILQD